MLQLCDALRHAPSASSDTRAIFARVIRYQLPIIGTTPLIANVPGKGWVETSVYGLIVSTKLPDSEKQATPPNFVTENSCDRPCLRPLPPNYRYEV